MFVTQVISNFEDTGLLEYRMSEFPLSDEMPSELRLLNEALHKYGDKMRTIAAARESSSL